MQANQLKHGTKQMIKEVSNVEIHVVSNNDAYSFHF